MPGFAKRFLTFDKLIATGLIKIFYWIGVAGIAIAVLVAIFTGFGQGFMTGLGMIVAAPVGGVIGLIFWRFICEVYIVVFGMYDRLGNIQDALGAKSKEPGAT